MFVGRNDAIESRERCIRSVKQKSHPPAKDGYDSSSKVCQWFWEIIDEDLEAADKRKLLQFITGSDRAPGGGLGELPLVLSRHGPDSDRLPQAH